MYQVRLDLVEATKIADNLGMAWDEWSSRYTDHSWPGTRSFLLAQNKVGCVFLEQAKRSKTGICLIQPFKPTACEEWSASPDRRECQEGLRRYWGLKVNSSGELEGPERRLREFDAFVKSLECSDAPSGASGIRARQADPTPEADQSGLSCKRRASSKVEK